MTPLTEASKKLSILVHQRCNNFSSNNFFSKQLLPTGNHFSQHNCKTMPFSFFCTLPKRTGQWVQQGSCAYPVLVSLELDEGALAQVSAHVSEGLWHALVVAVVRGQRAHQLLRRPLPVLRRQARRQAARGQRVCQLQRSYSRGIIARMGIQMGN